MKLIPHATENNSPNLKEDFGEIDDDLDDDLGDLLDDDVDLPDLDEDADLDKLL